LESQIVISSRHSGIVDHLFLRARVLFSFRLGAVVQRFHAHSIYLLGTPGGLRYDRFLPSPNLFFCTLFRPEVRRQEEVLRLYELLRIS